MPPPHFALVRIPALIDERHASPLLIPPHDKNSVYIWRCFRCLRRVSRICVTKSQTLSPGRFIEASGSNACSSMIVHACQDSISVFSVSRPIEHVLHTPEACLSPHTLHIPSPCTLPIPSVRPLNAACSKAAVD